MKLRFLEILCCPSCREPLVLHDPRLSRVGRDPSVCAVSCRGDCPFPELTNKMRDCQECSRYEVTGGSLICRGCSRRFDIERGIPQFSLSHSIEAQSDKRRTAVSYGYLWQKTWSRQKTWPQIDSYHFEKMEQALKLQPHRGLVLDAGCGQGIDLFNHARRPGVEAVGVDLSEGGSRATFERTTSLVTAHVAQTDLSRLPFRDNAFDFIYTYGVLHHLPHPEEGLRELVRVLKHQAMLAAYLYEDFEEKPLLWRGLLFLANLPRAWTIRLPHRILYLGCSLFSPLLYLAFAVPSQILRRMGPLRPLGLQLPFRHATGPWSLTGDLYDRYSVPIERRYSRRQAQRFFEEAGLTTVTLANEYGWMLAGIKKGPPAS